MHLWAEKSRKDASKTIWYKLLQLLRAYTYEHGAEVLCILFLSGGGTWFRSWRMSRWRPDRHSPSGRNTLTALTDALFTCNNWGISGRMCGDAHLQTTRRPWLRWVTMTMKLINQRKYFSIAVPIFSAPSACFSTHPLAAAAGFCWEFAKQGGRCCRGFQGPYWTARPTGCEFNPIRDPGSVPRCPVAGRGHVWKSKKSPGEKVLQNIVFFSSKWWERSQVDVNVVILCVQEDLEQQEEFRTRLEALEKQSLNIQNKLEVSLIEPDSVKVGRNYFSLFSWPKKSIVENQGCL